MLKNTTILQNITGANRATLIKMYLQKDSLEQVSISMILASGEVYSSTGWNTTAFSSKPNHPTTQLLQQTVWLGFNFVPNHIISYMQQERQQYCLVTVFQIRNKFDQGTINLLFYVLIHCQLPVLKHTTQFRAETGLNDPHFSLSFSS